MRKLLLPALAACSMLAVSAPVATASSHKAHSSAKAAKVLGKLSGAIKGLQKNVAKIEKLNAEAHKGLSDSLHGVDLRVDTLVNNLAGVKAVQDAIVAGVPQITNGLTALGNAINSS